MYLLHIIIENLVTIQRWSTFYQSYICLLRVINMGHVH